MYGARPMQPCYRILGAVLAWWCFAISAQASVRDVDPNQVEPDVLLSASPASVDREALQPNRRAEVATFRFDHYGAEAMRGEAEAATRLGLAPQVPVWCGAGRSSFNLLNQPLCSMLPMVVDGAPRSSWRMGSHRGPRAP